MSLNGRMHPEKNQLYSFDVFIGDNCGKNEFVIFNFFTYWIVMAIDKGK